MLLYICTLVLNDVTFQATQYTEPASLHHTCMSLCAGDIVLYNIFYEVFSVCTSIIGQTENGTLLHARNLDFGLLMG